LAQFPQVSETEELLQILQECHEQLDLWIAQSPANALLFLEDPTAAMKVAAAGTDLDLATMIELEAVLNGLAHKLDLCPSSSSGGPLNFPETTLNKAS